MTKKQHRQYALDGWRELHRQCVLEIEQLKPWKNAVLNRLRQYSRDAARFPEAQRYVVMLQSIAAECTPHGDSSGSGKRGSRRAA